MPSIKSTIKPISTTVRGLRVFRKSADAHIPTRGSPYAAGYDLYASENTHIAAKGGRKAVETGIVIAIPHDTYARVAPRSGLAFKHGIDTGAGVIDADYRGTIKVILFNHGENDFEIKKGDRIAQLILEKISTPEVVEVMEGELEETDRGANGFGSTGVSSEKPAEPVKTESAKIGESETAEVETTKPQTTNMM